jgi:hypothetical protein
MTFTFVRFSKQCTRKFSKSKIEKNSSATLTPCLLRTTRIKSQSQLNERTDATAYLFNSRASWTPTNREQFSYIIAWLLVTDTFTRKNEERISQSVDEGTRLQAIRRKWPSFTGRDKRNISPPNRPHRLWSPSSHLFIITVARTPGVTVAEV